VTAERVAAVPRVAVVTGAAKGIGRATVDALVADDVLPVLFDRDAVALALAERQLAERGIDHLAEPLDVTDEAAVERAMAGVVARFGRRTRALAVEWASHGIRVNAVAPTWVRTDLTVGLFNDPVLMAACST